MEPKVTIIIPLPRFNDYICEAIPYYENLYTDNFEILILPDEATDEKLSDKLNIRVIPSGKVGPAEKRDLGAEHARGAILAFTDDDAFPSPEWIEKALVHFEDEQVGAVGGPAVTPKNDDFWQKVSGFVYASFLMSGAYRRRYVSVGGVVEDYDLPSVNLIMRRDVFLKVGGFDSSFYPGEDTKLCLEVKKQNYKILYDPEVLVYHHRRHLFPTHFQQINNYALHRGYFVKKYPETSKKPVYFIPSFFLFGVVAGLPLSVFVPVLRPVYFGVIGLYFLLNLIINFKINPLMWFSVVLGVFLSHLSYGFYFIKGLLTSHLQR